MIIGCEKCGTKFRLKDDVVKPGGRRVRCSLCRHIFTVHPPGRPPVPEESGRRKTQGMLGPEDVPQGGQGSDGLAPGRPALDTIVDFEDFFSDIDEEFLQDELNEPRKRKRSPSEEAGKGDRGRGESVSPKLLASSERETRRPSLLRRIIRLFFLLVVMAGLAGVAVYYWAPELIPDYIPVGRPKPAVQIPDTGVSRLVLSDVAGNFVESETAGSLFVIRGKVRNEFPHSRSFIQVEGSILDDRGRLVLKRLAYAGNAMPDEELDRMSGEDIARAMNNSYGTDGMNHNVPPGAIIPFAIIFVDLPENVAEFKVEAVLSIAGTSR